MCDSCWNVKVFEAKKKKNMDCTGQDMLTMTFEELKWNLTQEWLKTKETHFNVFKKSVPDLNANEISFLTSGLMNGLNLNTELHVHFV